MGIENRPPSVAWDQFMIAKRSMLAEYDLALTHARAQVVSVHHGVVAEAAVRSWLSSFLPKRFGVAPGYLKSQSPEVPLTSHFDVIVYDQIEAPTLWIETNKDKSEDGRARIIPGEFVRAIIEVKSAFNSETVRAASRKLSELKPLMAGSSMLADPYPLYLPLDATLAMLFFEIRSEDSSDCGTLTLLRDLESFMAH